MKKLLKIVLFIAVCGLIGYGIGIGIALLMGDGDAPGPGIDYGLMALAVMLSLLSLIVSFFLNTLLHEAGHLVCGLLTGYEFLSFRVFKYALQKEDGKWRWKENYISGTLGQCLMAPPEEKPVPYFWYNLGGVLMNLLVVAISGTLVFCLDLPIVWLTLCMMLVATGLWMIFFNGVPMIVGGVPNDGMNILTLWRHPEQRKDFYVMLAVAKEQGRGRRLAELPEEWFASEPLGKGSSVMQMSARNLHYSLLMDRLQFDEARKMAEELLLPEVKAPMLFRMEVACDLILLELLTLRRRDVLEGLLSKRQLAYLRVNSRFSAIKCLTLYAYELLYNQDATEAKALLDELKARKDQYLLLGEAQTALALVEHIH